MSNEHIASHTVDKTKCIAHGCPCLGTMTASTSGSDEWLCGFHFGRDAVAWQKITMELNRLSWLVSAIQEMRLTYGRSTWPAAAKQAKYNARMNARSDLLPLPNELGPVWIRRLDEALVEAIGRAPRSDAVQAGLAGVIAVAETFTKAAFEIPEHA